MLLRRVPAGAARRSPRHDVGSDVRAGRHTALGIESRRGAVRHGGYGRRGPQRGESIVDELGTEPLRARMLGSRIDFDTI
jgi:hypothetical protein